MVIYEIKGNEVIKKLVTPHTLEHAKKMGFENATDLAKFMLREGEGLKPRFAYQDSFVCSFVDINDPVIVNGKIVERAKEVDING